MEQQIINALIKRITSTFQVKNIILFGSQIDGNTLIESDLDLVVILEGNEISNSWWARLKRQTQVSESVLDLKEKTPMDILVYSSAEWDLLSENGGSFYKQINASGKKLYARK